MLVGQGEAAGAAGIFDHSVLRNGPLRTSQTSYVVVQLDSRARTGNQANPGPRVPSSHRCRRSSQRHGTTAARPNTSRPREPPFRRRHSQTREQTSYQATRGCTQHAGSSVSPDTDTWQAPIWERGLGGRVPAFPPSSPATPQRAGQGPLLGGPDACLSCSGPLLYPGSAAPACTARHSRERDVSLLPGLYPNEGGAKWRSKAKQGVPEGRI